MNIHLSQIRSYRLHAHHLDQKLPADAILDAAGACGLQNSPPGAWETALFHRLEGCSLQQLHDALYQDKTLLQAWSFRGAPVVFPTVQSDIFLTPLIAQDGEMPWVYTRGITGALDFLQMTFEELLLHTQKAAGYLDSHTIQSKEALDRTLADLILPDLPTEKQPLWCAPSMYGNPDRQTVGGATVSFLLRPCSFSSMVVFGKRDGISPSFTSYKNWIGHMPPKIPDADKALVRKFLHCYGPATESSFLDWLGCSRQQAKRLWSTIAKEIEPVSVGKQTCYILSEDLGNLLSAEDREDRPGKLILLGAHDPYLDIKDRSVLLEHPTLQKKVWKTVANPGAILKEGRIVGIWKCKTLKNQLEIAMELFEDLQEKERKMLETFAEEYAGFRMAGIKKCTISGISEIQKI